MRENNSHTGGPHVVTGNVSSAAAVPGRKPVGSYVSSDRMRAEMEQ